VHSDSRNLCDLLALPDFTRLVLQNTAASIS
jgi:hypothetical protein